MRISDVVKSKGSQVITVRPDDTVAHLLKVLADHRIGAVVVSGDGASVEGIVSERDVVRHLHSSGTSVVDGPVHAIMTREVVTCEPSLSVEELEASMTEHRIRHVPVVVDGALTAIVSIGDIVKHHMDQLRHERDQLVGYIQQ
ncbi:MAG: CBS domain-containing protein [Dermatophilaceae bacterium]